MSSGRSFFSWPARVSHQSLSADEEIAIDDALAEADAGEFASDDEIQAIWDRHAL